jgi:hypothetical protein
MKIGTMNVEETVIGLTLGVVFIFVYFLTRRILLSKRRQQIPIKVFAWQRFIPSFSLIAAVFMFVSILHELEKAFTLPATGVSDLTFAVDLLGLAFIVIGVREIIKM